MIYLIHNSSENTLKIGVTQNIQKRMMQLQTGNSSNLNLLNVIEGSYDLEKELHEKFKDYWINREWFYYNSKILEYFDVNEIDTDYTKYYIYKSFIHKVLECDLSKSDIELFLYLVSNYAKNKPFKITDFIKETVSKTTGKNKTSYNNSIKALVKAEMIYSVAPRSYKINPRYAFEGSSNMRNKAVIEMVSHCKDC